MADISAENMLIAIGAFNKSCGIYQSWRNVALMLGLNETWYEKSEPHGGGICRGARKARGRMKLNTKRQ